MRRLAPAAPLVACLAVLAGCSDRYEGRVAVSGSVTLDGAPLSGATITFEPLDGQGSTSGAAVEKGAYRIERASGLKPGKYLVRLTAGDGRTPAAENPDVNPDAAGAPGGAANIVSADRVPADYSERSKQQVEVTADGPNTFDFAIPKAREPRKGKR